MKVFTFSGFLMPAVLFLSLRESPAQSLPISTPKDVTWMEKAVFFANAEKGGSLVFAQDNARYTAAGFNWPWANILAVRGEQLNLTRNVGVSPYNFVFRPRWMSNGDVLFEHGDPTSSSNLYSLARWDGKSAQAQTLVSELSWKIVQPSPSGRFLAFIRGGQPIPGRGGATPASLCTLDLQTKVEKRWGEAEPLFGSVAWASDDILLFSLAPSEAEQSAMRPAAANAKALEWKPTIYEASLASGKMRSLIEGAMRPAPSPDGKWLLYLSYTDPSPPAPETAPKIKPDPTLAPVKTQETLWLVLSRADGSEARLVRGEARGAPHIVWFPDSSGFLLCDTRLAGSDAGKTALSVAVSRFDLKESNPQRVGSFRYIAPNGTELSEDDRLWRPIAVTRDKKYLMSELTQFEAAPNNGLMLQRFDLASGQSEVVARIGSVRGLDWREHGAK